MNLNQYICASLFNKQLKGYYLDEFLTTVRLLGSNVEGEVVRAKTYSDGDFKFDLGMKPYQKGLFIGGRSVQWALCFGRRLDS